LAWKLALVVRQDAANEALLETYDEERRAVGQRMINTATVLAKVQAMLRQGGALVPSTNLHEAAKAAFLGLSCAYTPNGDLVAAPCHYSDQRLTVGPRPAGYRLPPIPLVALSGNIPCSIYDLLYRRNETVVFLYCGTAAAADEKTMMRQEDAAASIRSRFPTRTGDGDPAHRQSGQLERVSVCVVVGDEETKRQAEALTDGIVFLDESRRFGELMGHRAGRLILRPDGYVGAIFPATVEPSAPRAGSSTGSGGVGSGVRSPGAPDEIKDDLSYLVRYLR
jgi:hypothetical protein